MSSKLPPRRPKAPLMKGPRPVTKKFRPSGSPAKEEPKAKDENVEAKPVEKVQEVKPETRKTVVEEAKSASMASAATSASGTVNSDTLFKKSPEATVENKKPEPIKEPVSRNEAPKKEVAAKKETVERKPEVKNRQPQPKKEKKGVDAVKVILVLLVLMLGGVVGFLAYDKLSTEKVLTAKLTDAQEQTAGLKTDIELKVEEISMLQDSLRLIIAEKEELGVALSNERARIAELEGMKSQLRAKQLSINSLNGKLKTYRKDYETAQASMGALVAENQRLVSEKVKLEQMVQEKIDSLEKLAKVQVKMAEKVSHASTLSAENINVLVYNTGGKEMKNPRAMMAGKIRASMNLGDNKYAEHGPKDIYLRVIEPSGNTLYSGNKSFTAEGRKVIYTEKQTIDFDNSRQRIAFYYNKGSRYIPGKYTIEIWSDAKRIGTSEFVLRP